MNSDDDSESTVEMANFPWPAHWKLGSLRWKEICKTLGDIYLSFKVEISYHYTTTEEEELPCSRDMFGKHGLIIFSLTDSVTES